MAATHVSFGARDTGIPRAVVQFAVTGLAAVVLLGVVGALLLRRIAHDEAVRQARTLTRLAGEGIVEPKLGAALAGEKDGLTNLDDVVRQHVKKGPVVRVKIWRRDGTVLYSDEERLIGRRYKLEGDEREALATPGHVTAEVSDLSRPENEFDGGLGKLLEVYLSLTVDRKRVLYEQYLRFDAVAATGRRLFRSFLPPLVGTLLLLELVQVPLAWSLTKRLREGQREREGLLVRAVEASDAERRRLAAGLHDGPVQELAGIAYGLAADADALAADSPPEARDALRRAAADTRQTMRRLRALLFAISPPTLHRAGLENALTDLLAPVSEQGVHTRLEVPPSLELPPEVVELLYRGAQEGLRNVLAHAEAQSVAVEVERSDHRVTLTVSDDGRGFTPEEAERRRRSGHVGLDLLRDLVTNAEGTLALESEPGRGTRLRVEVPVT